MDQINVAMHQFAERCLASVEGVGPKQELVVFLHHLQIIHRRKAKSDTRAIGDYNHTAKMLLSAPTSPLAGHLNRVCPKSPSAREPSPSAVKNFAQNSQLRSISLSLQEFLRRFCPHILA